jgi:hypothetical protein
MNGEVWLHADSWIGSCENWSLSPGQLYTWLFDVAASSKKAWETECMKFFLFHVLAI